MSKDNNNLKEKVQLYMDNYTKRQLATMLAIRDISKETVVEKIEIEYPGEPYRDNNMWVDYNHHCRSWSDCTNPCKDCINCPLHFVVQYQDKYHLSGIDPNPFPTNITCSIGDNTSYNLTAY